MDPNYGIRSPGARKGKLNTLMKSMLLTHHPNVCVVICILHICCRACQKNVNSVFVVVGKGGLFSFWRCQKDSPKRTIIRTKFLTLAFAWWYLSFPRSLASTKTWITFVEMCHWGAVGGICPVNIWESNETRVLRFYQLFKETSEWVMKREFFKRRFYQLFKLQFWYTIYGDLEIEIIKCV